VEDLHPEEEEHPAVEALEVVVEVSHRADEVHPGVAASEDVEAVVASAAGAAAVVSAVVVGAATRASMLMDLLAFLAFKIHQEVDTTRRFFLALQPLPFLFSYKGTASFP